jgi:hypothetical protein
MISPLSGSGRLVRQINAIGAATRINLANRTPGTQVSRTTRGTFIRVPPAQRVVAPQKQSDTWY